MPSTNLMNLSYFLTIVVLLIQIDPEEALSPTKHDDLVSTNVPNE